VPSTQLLVIATLPDFIFNHHPYIYHFLLHRRMSY
jgi:hypothetical protein